MKKQSKSFEIALSAIACALSAIFLTVGSINPFLLASGYLLSTVAFMLPLSKNFIWGATLGAIGAGLIALPFALWRIVPYAVFFGLHPIVNHLQRRFIKRKTGHIICYVAKAIWFDFAMWLSYFVLTRMVGMTFPAVVEEFFFYIIFIGGTLLFAVYDFFIFRFQFAADNLIARIRK